MNDFLHNLDWVLPLRQGWLTPILQGFTLLGYTAFFFAALPILYWAWDKAATSRLALGLLLAALVTFFLKDFFEDPRPAAYYAFAGMRPESYGLPSGHTLMAVVFWFTLATEIGKKWSTILSFVIVGAIAFSRLYLGVHDVEDVLAGFLIGGILLLMLHLVRAREWRDQVGPAIIVSYLLAFVVGLGFWPGDTPPGRVFLVAGFAFGWILGRIIQKSRFRFHEARGWRIASTLFVGLALLGGATFALRAGLEAVSLAPTVKQILGGFAAGLLITLVIPALLLLFRVLRPRLPED